MLDHARLVDDLHDPVRAARVGEQRVGAELQQDLGVGGASAAHRADALGARTVEDDDEPRDAAFDDLFVDDVGLVQAHERHRVGGVLDLDGERGRAGGSLSPPTGWFVSGQGVGGRLVTRNDDVERLGDGVVAGQGEGGDASAEHGHDRTSGDQRLAASGECHVGNLLGTGWFRFGLALVEGPFMRMGPDRDPGRCYRRFGDASNTRAHFDMNVTSPPAGGSARRAGGGWRTAAPSWSSSPPGCAKAG